MNLRWHERFREFFATSRLDTQEGIEIIPQKHHPLNGHPESGQPRSQFLPTWHSPAFSQPGRVVEGHRIFCTIDGVGYWPLLPATLSQALGLPTLLYIPAQFQLTWHPPPANPTLQVSPVRAASWAAAPGQATPRKPGVDWFAPVFSTTRSTPGPRLGYPREFGSFPT